jgi:hypothetical protein
MLKMQQAISNFLSSYSLSHRGNQKRKQYFSLFSSGTFMILFSLSEKYLLNSIQKNATITCHAGDNEAIFKVASIQGDCFIASLLGMNRMVHTSQ